MRTVSLSIDSLVDKVDRGEIRLPEIQRSYVWKPTQVAGLIDSLYRGYPSGSLLLWETDVAVGERHPAIRGPNAEPMVRPQYLLDGQQRLTSLHRVFKNHEAARVVFNVEERFQIESAATKKDPRWVRVHEVLQGSESLYALVARLHQRLPHIEPDEISRRVERVRKISDYVYHIEIIESLDYDEVTDIFVRVNSKGRALRAVDLALATISGRWPGVISKLEDEVERWKRHGYRHVDFSFLTRSLAATANDPATLRGFTTTPVEKLEDGWQRTRRGLEHTIALLRNNAGITTSELIPSMNALVPLVVYLGHRDDSAMSSEEANALIYWLFGAFLLQRFSGAVETVIAQDAAAARGGGGVEKLYANLGIVEARLSVTPDNLVGRGAGSPYFLLRYLAARKAGAKDWWYGTEISLGGEGGQSIEYHHIHPRSTLASRYSKAEINDLANLAFISAKANKKISNRSPVKYFAELLAADPRALQQHFVPEDEALRTVGSFRRFLDARRLLLAEEMTDLLDSYRPRSITDESPAATDPTTGETLTIIIYTETYDPLDGIIVFEARRQGEVWTASIGASELDRFLSDLGSGLASEFELCGERVTAEADAGVISVPAGPLLVVGTLEDWQKVWEREYEEAVVVERLPELHDSPLWEGERTVLSVLTTE